MLCAENLKTVCFTKVQHNIINPNLACECVPEGVKTCKWSCLSVGARVAQEVIKHQSGQRLLHQLAVRRVKDQVAKVIQTEALV